MLTSSFRVNWILVSVVKDHHMDKGWPFWCIAQANGILAVTVYSTTPINAKDISGTLNPYVRFYLDKAQELGRSTVQENTIEPRWNETHFLMLNNLSSTLSLELRNQQTGSKDRRIARAHFELSELESDVDYSVEGL